MGSPSLFLISFTEEFDAKTEKAHLWRKLIWMRRENEYTDERYGMRTCTARAAHVSIIVYHTQDHVNDNCEYSEILCVNDCGAKFQKRFLQKHLDKDCAKKIIACPYCDDRHLREERKVSETNACFALVNTLILPFSNHMSESDNFHSIEIKSCNNVCF